MSKYIGEFTSINSVDYKIEITTKTGTKTESVILAETPLTVTGSDNDTIYEPVKTTGATVTILTDRLPVDIYSGSALGTKLNVTSGSNVVWTGFLTPCAYSQGYDNPLEELQLEFVDGLSVLQDIPYSSISKSVTNFMDVIFNCLKKSNCYKYLYVNDTVQFTSTGTENIMQKLRVSEQNFFEEKDYDAQPDEEVAWSCYDVLSEVMRYMGYTMTAQGDSIYVIDYDAIAKNRTRYFRYDISGNKLGSSTVVNLSQSHTISGADYAETGNNIDLSAIFNKLVITDEFYKIESVIPGLNDAKNLTNITANYDTTLTGWMHTNDRFLESGVFTVDNENFFATLMKNDTGDIFFVVGKFYSNPMIQTWHYSHNNGSAIAESSFTPMMYSKLWNGKGAIIVGYYVAPVDSNKYNIWRVDYQANWAALSQQEKLNSFAKLTSIADIPNVKLSYYILCLNQDTNHITHDQVRNYPYFKITKNISTTFGGTNGYLMIKGELLRHYQYNAPFPQSGKVYRHKDTKKTSIYANEGYFWARLKWGAMYWEQTGDYKTQGQWVNYPAFFKVFYGDPTVEKRVDDWQDKWLNLYNTCAVWGIDDEGYYIPVPDGYNLEGSVELTIYANKDTKGKWARNNKKDKKNSYSGYPPKVVLFKDLDITVGYADGSLVDDSMNQDTCYCNEVTGYENINEADGIDFKICTFDDKTPSYSTVVDSSGKSQYLDKTYNLATGQNLRQEEQFIVKFISQYEEPRVQYSCNLKHSLNFRPYCLLEYNQMSGKKFIIDSYSVDYRFNKIELRIVEKNKSYS